MKFKVLFLMKIFYLKRFSILAVVLEKDLHKLYF